MMSLFAYAANNNNSKLLFIIFPVIVFAIWSNNTYSYAQQSSPPSASVGSSPSTTISPEIKAKMCNPNNPALKVVNTTEARICGISKTVKPPLSPSVAPLAQLPNSTGRGNNTGITTTTTTTTNNSIPIVLRPLAGGTCLTGYHLVSGAVCIKDLPSAALTKTAASATIPTSTTKATKSVPIPSSITRSQPSGTSHTNNNNGNNNNNANNEENFHTKILKSFNKNFK